LNIRSCIERKTHVYAEKRNHRDCIEWKNGNRKFKDDGTASPDDAWQCKAVRTLKLNSPLTASERFHQFRLNPFFSIQNERRCELGFTRGNLNVYRWIYANICFLRVHEAYLRIKLERGIGKKIVSAIRFMSSLVN